MTALYFESQARPFYQIFIFWSPGIVAILLVEDVLLMFKNTRIIIPILLYKCNIKSVTKQEIVDLIWNWIWFYHLFSFVCLFGFNIAFKHLRSYRDGACL